MMKLNSPLLETLWKAGEPKLHSDDDCQGLYFKVGGPKASSWLFRYQLHGVRQLIGLGPFPQVGLAEAREKARANHKLLAQGIDPKRHRAAERSRQRADAAKPHTMTELAEAYLKLRGWDPPPFYEDDYNGYNTCLRIRNYILPALGDVLVADIDASVIEKVLLPVWKTTPVQAREIYRNIAELLDYAVAVPKLLSSNPARSLRKYLPPQPAGGHRKALPYEQMPELMARLRNYQSNQKAFRPEIDRAAIIAARKDGMLFREIRDKFGVPHETARTICITGKTEQIDYELVKARALEFLILIGSPRGVEMRKTQWREIDEDHEILTIPRAPESLRAQGLTRTRMKVKKGDDFIIPLNRRAMDILNEMRPISDGDYVFPGSLKGRNQEIRERLADKTPRIAGVPMGRQEPLRFLRKKLGYNVDVHGFRSTFTDWAFATGRFREIAIELCLDHAYGNKVQRAYRRGQLVEERRELLEVWSNYCAGRSADIIRPRFGRKTTA